MFEFNNNHIITGYIKELLHDFNLPKAKTIKHGMTVFRNGYYIDSNFIYKATRTAVFGVDFSSVDDTYYDDASGTMIPYLYKIDHYIYGRSYLNITKNLELNSSIYNTYTHNYLGDYLRFYRDYKKIDLMSMYNCFNGEVGNNINISKEGLYSFVSNDGHHVIYMVPVKFYQEYTIAIDSDLPVEFMACLYDNGRVCLSTDEYSGIYSGTYSKVVGMAFNKPILYSKLKTLLSDVDFARKDEIYSQEKNLRLMIKLPINNKSSVVVLEGDYTQAAQQSLNVVGFNWAEVGDCLDTSLDWFVRDSDGRFRRIFDNRETYYDVNGVPAQKYEKGNYYYVADKSKARSAESVVAESDEYVYVDNKPETPGPDDYLYYLDNEPVYLDPDGVFYSFSDSHLVTNYEAINMEREISYFLDDSFLDSAPAARDASNIFVDESNGRCYMWDSSGHEYRPLTNNDYGILQIYSRRYNSRMQLLFVNDGENHPFADKLVGYLLGNVITSDDGIMDNIRRLQKAFYYRKNPSAKPDYDPAVDRVQDIGLYTFPKHAGVWSNELRDLTYELLRVKNNVLSSSFDSIGFVDKDAERLLGDDVSYDKEGHMISGGVR